MGPPEPPTELPVPGVEAGGPAGPQWRAALRPCRLPALFLAMLVAVLMAARAGLLLLYPGQFASLRAADMATAFLRGARFDLSAACTFAGLPLLVMAFPLAWSRRRRLRFALGWLVFAAFVLLSFGAAADLAYFGYVSRHVGPEVNILLEDIDQLAETAFSLYKPALFGLAALWVAAFLAWRRLLLREPLVEVPATGRTWALAPLCALLLLAGARGSFGGSRLVTEDAFEGGVPPAATQLALNGPFCAVQSLLDAGARVEDVLDRGEALRTARELLVSSAESVPDPDYPLFRSRPPAAGPRPNVVVVMLEGWSATTVDELRAERGLPPLGITPRFSALAREGLLLSRMYASGQRTRVGLTGLLAGVGGVPGVPTLGQGLETWRLSFLGDLARKEGLATCFLMGFMAASQREAQIAKAAGFDEVLAGEEMLGEGEKGAAALDHRLFEAASRRLRTLKEPFLAFIHTASTHLPYGRPAGEKAPFPDDTVEHRYWNAVAYCDRSLGEFIDRARADGWFGRTLFVVVSDHIQRGEAGEPEGPGMFQIPGLLEGPGVPRGVHPGVAGHTDVLPTIVHLCGWGVPYAALGRSMLEDGAPLRGAHGSTPTLTLRVEAGGWVTRGPRARSASGGRDADAIERRLLSQVEAGRWLILHNRFAK